LIAMDTVVNLDGICYLFETQAGKTRLKVLSETTPTTDTDPVDINLPHAWLITRKNGTPLFAIRPDECERPFRIMTAEQLYAEKIQWFEPLADNYRELIWNNPDSSVPSSDSYVAYKHLSWADIITFSIIERWSIQFRPGADGDWKHHPQGGDKYLLVNIEGHPFWADGVGQIPFAVNTYKKFARTIGDKNIAILETVDTGINAGDGIPYLGEADHSNSYDNFMVLRGSLWASENYQIITTIAKVYGRGQEFGIEKHEVEYRPTSDNKLRSTVTQESVSKYAVWNVKK